MTPRTVADAGQYWQQYYSGEFVFGLGTEQIITLLQRIPPVGTWLDLGSGSESLLWSIPLDTERLIALDRDPHRLARLRAYAATGQPRGAYRTVLDLCGRDRGDFALHGTRLAGCLVADCLTGTSLPVRPGTADLVTQFGLLGLAAGPAQFARAWAVCHQSLSAGGWAAGANWTATNPAGRVRLSEPLYASALARSGITPLHIERVPITGDPDFDSVWIYLGRKA